MLAIFLRILSVVGIVLLVMLGLLLAMVLLVLFFPVSYRISGRKTPEKLAVKAKANWLFGLFRLRYAYPEPGKITVKLLWFTLYDSSEEKVSDRTTDEKNAKKKSAASASADSVESEKPDGQSKQDTFTAPSSKSENMGMAETDGKETQQEDGSWISKKIKKIQYTIRSFYDKIKIIWQNISYYAELLKEEETKQLFNHGMFRLWKILKSLRPRKLKAEILFGTGAPDTTGYVFGLYSILMPFLGPGVVVTPDFQRAVLQGSIQASGFMTVAVLLRHVLQVALDKRLKKFINKLGSRGAEPGKDINTSSATVKSGGSGRKNGR